MELENENKKLCQELELLKEKNETLKEKVQELFDINKKFEKIIAKVESEKKAISRDLLELAKLSEEFEEEYGRKTRRLLMEVEEKSNALGEVKEELKEREEALKIAKVRECDYIGELDNMEKEVNSLKVQHSRRPQSLNQRGSFPYTLPICYLCSKHGHIKANCYKFQRVKNFQNKFGGNPRGVRKIWVRRDLVDAIRVREKDSLERTLAPIWVVKRNESLHLVKPLWVDSNPTKHTLH
ncbi:hypothetical protein Dsin_031466 [Dipteronia sinensis]|uniref:CCHC-type domain-containing protein n=1 Tax=Dipteronia sinensis TaxID=43782 RepID=A0AAD9ZLN7_9ROSI|nr:hypothetical protein Dsin_031466 [Dipteronia sinensis]